MLLLGACGIVYEYALGALGNNLIGSSHEQIFIIIGIMMFSMGLGAALQSHIQNNLLMAFLLLELALGVVGGSSTLLIYTSYVYSTSYLLFTYVFAVLIGVGIGLEIPLLIRINADYALDLRTNLSQTLFLDYVGALVGALAFTYLLLTNLSLASIAIVVGMVNTCLALFGLVYFRPLLQRYRDAALVGACLWLLGLSCALFLADDWVATLEQRTFADPIIHSETSPYQHLVLTKRGAELRLFINGHLQFSSKDEDIYHELLVHMPLHVAAKRERVLILGGGDGLALRDVLKYRDVKEVLLVDLDPAIVRLASTQSDLVGLNQGALLDARVSATIGEGIAKGERVAVTRPSILNRALLDRGEYQLADVHVLTVDADRFIQKATGLFDVVLLDLPDPKSIELAKLYSIGFYRALRHRLTPHGVIAIQSTSPRRAKDVFLAIGKTLRAAGWTTLPYHDFLPSFGDWGWWLAWTHDVSPEHMRSRFSALTQFDVDMQYLTLERAAAVFAFGRGELEARPGLLANSKLRPVLIDYYKKGFAN